MRADRRILDQEVERGHRRRERLRRDFLLAKHQYDLLPGTHRRQEIQRETGGAGAVADNVDR